MTDTIALNELSSEQLYDLMIELKMKLDTQPVPEQDRYVLCDLYWYWYVRVRGALYND